MSTADDRDALRELDELSERVAKNSRRIDRNSGRIDDLEEQSRIDRELLLELQADRLLQTEQVGHLEEALASARRIGAAVGIVMAQHRMTEEQAFGVIRKASNDRNAKLRHVAEDIVESGSTDGLVDA